MVERRGGDRGDRTPQPRKGRRALRSARCAQWLLPVPRPTRKPVGDERCISPFERRHGKAVPRGGGEERDDRLEGPPKRGRDSRVALQRGRAGLGERTCVLHERVREKERVNGLASTPSWRSTWQGTLAKRSATRTQPAEPHCRHGSTGPP